jgi:hypothetical protein
VHCTEYSVQIQDLTWGQQCSSIWSNSSSLATRKTYSIISTRVRFVPKISRVPIVVTQIFKTNACMSRVMCENWWIDATHRVWVEVDQNSELLLLFCITNKQINMIEALNKDSLTPSYFIQQQNMFMKKNERILHRFNIIGRFSINNEEIPRVVCKLGMVQCTPCSPPPLQKIATQKSCPHTQICNIISYAFVRTVS